VIKALSLLWLGIAIALSPAGAMAARAWVIGDISLVEDYRSYADPNWGVLITLINRSYYGAETSPAICENRFRIVTGEENVTAETQKSFLAMALAARVSGQRMRLFVNPDNIYQGSCAVQIASIGDL
jgi:hypothetical protein